MKTYSNFTFDKQSGLYYLGKSYDSELNDRERQGNLNDIHAIQIIPKRILGAGGMAEGSGNGILLSDELNLVFKDCDRINVMDHGDDLEESALQLGKYLHVPIWTAPKPKNFNNQFHKVK